MRTEDEQTESEPFIDLEVIVEAETQATGTAPQSCPPGRTAGEHLAELAIALAAGRRIMRRIKDPSPIALVVEVPSAAWVEPVSKALARLSRWSEIFPRDGTDRLELRGDAGNQKAARALAKGGRVFGVSQSTDRLLPPTLLAAADIRLVIPAPTSSLLAKVIKATSGKWPRKMPPGLAAALDFPDLCAAIRAGSSPADCVERLLVASRRVAAPEVGLADVPPLEELHGYGEAMTWARTLLADLERWRRGEILFRDIDRCVVLASEPGLGKTSFARAVAKAANLPFTASSVGQWFSGTSGYLDSVVKAIDAILRPPTTPALILLDELDAVPDRRTLSDHNRAWWQTVVTHLLTSLDGAASGDAAQLVIIGATNHPEKLDPALIRPGRLNRVVRVAHPDAGALAGILRQHLGTDLPDEDLFPVAELAAGATGAEVAAWVKRARTTARMAARPMFLDDLLREVAPPDARSPEYLRTCAYHEAAHAVIALATGTATVAHVSLVRSGESGGHALLEPKNAVPSRSFIEGQVKTALAGRAGELVFYGEPSAGAQSDLAKATQLVAALHASLGLGDNLTHRAALSDAHRLLAVDRGLLAVVETDLVRLQEEAVRLVNDHRRTIEAVAEALLRKRVLSRSEFEALVGSSSRDKLRQ